MRETEALNSTLRFANLERFLCLLVKSIIPANRVSNESRASLSPFSDPKEMRNLISKPQQAGPRIKTWEGFINPPLTGGLKRFKM